MSFLWGSANPDQAPEIIKFKITGCKPESGGVGLSLNLHNVVLEIAPGSAAEQSKLINVGDRVIGCDGEQLKGKQLSSTIQPADVHEFEIERSQGWAGLSVEDTDLAEEADADGMRALERRRDVTVQKTDGQIGICPEVYFPDGSGSGVIKISKVSAAPPAACRDARLAAPQLRRAPPTSQVYPGSHASSSGVVSQGDTIVAINGKSVEALDGNPLDVAC